MKNFRFKKHCFLFWQNFGIKNVKISFNEKELDVYNVSFPKKKKHAWKNALAIEKYIKRKSREEDFILAIEFNHIKRPKRNYLLFKRKARPRDCVTT